ncbi:hypothetical protein EDF18_1622 [Frigoribacterium sp. PhB107]|uniref:hypothetical protein n=1 Tax=Frigoribacterium sp. PhB107 TaxID=2485172 RepID=UPI000F466FFD|nr:hypothetical protein [Frigoribacterium sp. PhB107]ROP78963.1 hypothetical protein EDF18_1622 [Frigoribacterium sp. PhB107]
MTAGTGGPGAPDHDEPGPDGPGSPDHDEPGEGGDADGPDADGPDADGPDAPLPSGWVRIGERSWWSSWAGYSAVFVVTTIVYFGAQAGRFFDGLVPFPSDLLLGAVLIAALMWVATAVRNAIYPQPWVNLDTDQLRAGTRRTVALVDVDRALVPLDPALRSDVLVLRLTAKEARVEIILRDRRGPRLDGTSTRVLAEALRRTSVAMPTSATDPTGRFGRYNFPGHIGLGDAVALVERPPAPGAPLPASW